MSAASASLPHVLSAYRRCGTAGYAIPRPIHLRMPQLAGPLRSSHAPLLLGTKILHHLDKRHRRTTGSQLVTDTASANHKSP